MIKTSFGLFVFTGNEFSFSFYEEILTDSQFYKSLIYTIYLGVIPTIVSVTFGVGLAILAFLIYKREKKMFALAKFPIVISYSIYTFSVILLIMQTGLISRVLYFFNIIDESSSFPLLVYDKYGVGIMIVYLLKQVPFVFFVVYGTLVKVGRKYIDTSYNLGANTLETIFKVILPTIKSSIISVFLLCFAFNFGTFEVPYILGNPKYETIAVMSYRYYTSPTLEQRPLSMVINVLIIAVCFIALFFYINRSKKYESI
ncbi:MAG: ABC transporter permease [Bacilli bacterium]